MTPLRWRCACQLGAGVALAVTSGCGPVQQLAETSATVAAGTSDTSHGSTTSGTPPTGSTTSTTSTTSTDTSGIDDGTFIVKSDFHGPELECDIYAQDCPAGQKCAWWGESIWDATKCVEVTGDKVPGEACTPVGGPTSGIDDCVAGAWCWNVDSMNIGTCVALCTGSEEALTCPPGFVCLTSRLIAICYETCDPLLQDCERDDALCLPDDFEGFAYCSRDGGGLAGVANDPCKGLDDCAPGYACRPSAEAPKACLQDFYGCCQPFCEFPGGDCPNPDQQCRQWYDPMNELPAGAEKLGVCAIPA